MTEAVTHVEVPVDGTVIVESGDVHGIESEKTAFVPCTCRDDVHRLYDRTHNLGGIPHLVGVTTYTMVWKPKQA